VSLNFSWTLQWWL